MSPFGVGVPVAGVALERDGTGLLTDETPVGWTLVDDPDWFPVAETVLVWAGSGAEEGAEGPVEVGPVVEESLRPSPGFPLATDAF